MSTPMSLEDFNRDFVVRIASYTTSTETTIVHVVFEVKCTVNHRVGAFMTDVDTTTLTEGYTTDDVVNVAWDTVKSDVNPWAVINVQHDTLTAFTPQTTTSDISVTDFNTYFTVSVGRYELYPSISPSSWCVAFTVCATDKPDIKMYLDSNVPVNDWCNNVFCVDVVTAVWDKLKVPICSWAANELIKSQVLNTTYVPTVVTI